MKLIIAEKPSVAKDLARVLADQFTQHEGYWEGKEYLISWAVGHMLELEPPEGYDPTLSTWLISSLPVIPEKFRRKPRGGMTKQLRLIKKLAQRDDVDGWVNACDAAREGELIFREIEEYVDCGKPALRLWLQSMTEKAIKKAFDSLQPAADFDGLSAAAYSRSEADWLIGINATRGITKRLKGRREKGVWSAGRVQTPTLAILVHRELKVLAHVPVPFWRLLGTFSANGHEYTAQYRRSKSAKDGEKIWQEKDAVKLQKACQAADVEITEAVTESKRQPPRLYSLTALQKEANSRFGMSARRTLGAAQRLYESHKALTYPRTDYDGLPEDYRDTVAEVLGVLASGDAAAAFSEANRHTGVAEAASALQVQGLQNESRTFDDKKVGDHFAIIPTGKLPSTPLGGDDAKVYELVLRRFCAAFMGPSTWQTVKRNTLVASAEATFFTDSKRLIVPGWQAVDRVPKPSENLPDLGVEVGEQAQGKATAIELEADQTRPSKRYTEASLLKAMETASDLDIEGWEEIEDDEIVEALRQKGLGTPATRADIIEALIAKGYVSRGGKTLRASAKGITLIDFLERLQADDLAKADLTAEMEFHLHQVEQGQRDRSVYMGEVESSVRSLVEKLQNFDYDELFKEEEPVGVCPTDGHPIREGLKGYRCVKEPVANLFDLTIKHLGKEASVSLKDIAAQVAESATSLKGVVSAAADSKRTNAIIRVERATTGPDDGFSATLEALAAAVPEGILKEWSVKMADADVCGFTVWKEFRGRFMNRPVVTKLLETKDTGPLDGFVSMRGETYAGQIRLGEDLKLEFEPVKGYRGSDDTGAVAPELVSYIVDKSAYLSCPKCNTGQLVESPTHFDCQGGKEGDGCGLKMPRTVCKREMTRVDLTPYFSDEPGHTDWIEDFISRKGRPFTARLVRKPNGRHGFEFKPREAGPKKVTKKKSTKKKATKKKVTKKKTSPSHSDS